MRPASPPPPPAKKSFWSWLTGLFSRPEAEPSRERSLGAQEQRVLAEFCRQFDLPFKDLGLLKLALTHRSYLSVTGQGPRESNERLEFLGDSVLGLVTSEFLYRRHPDEHEGQLTKTKSLLVSKAILSRRALRIGLGRFVLMSHSEVESGGRQRLSILADAFESVIGAVYLDQGFEPARAFITKHLLSESDAITSDKRHTNYKSHLQEYVQNAFRTHPVYRIRSEYGPDHSKHFMVEVMVGKRTLGEGRGHNKKEAEQAAARDALEKVERLRRRVREDEDREAAEQEPRPEPARREAPVRRAVAPPVREPEPAPREDADAEDEETSERGPRRRRSRRGGRGRHGERAIPAANSAPEPMPIAHTEHDEHDEHEPYEEHEHVTKATNSRLEPEAPFEDVESPRVDLAPEPAGAPAPSVHPARVKSFGRGRRRDPAAGAPLAPETGAAPRALEPEPTAGGYAVASSSSPAEDRHVDVFAGVGADPSPPVVDVPGDDGDEVESAREREARIDEMERALDSFGRRRSPDYGRRGRRR